jgi:hypothetical protein
MARIPRTFFGDNLGDDPLASPERYLVHPVGQQWWGDADSVPLVTVSVGDHAATLRLTDVEAQVKLSASQWSKAEEVARRVARVDDEIGPLLFTSRKLVVEVPIAAAERLARFFLTLALPIGRLP